MTRSNVVWAVAVGCALGTAACEEDEMPASLLPASYPEGFIEVRDCRFSAEHELRNIRILADDAAAQDFGEQGQSFAVGSLVVKEEYRDPACSDLEGYTLMQRRGEGDDEALDGWVWQRLDVQGRWSGPDEASACASCHRVCTDGRDGVCADP